MEGKCPADMDMMCPNGAMTRMAGGNGGEGSDKGCQCVPDFLMAMVMQAPAGRLLDRSSGSFKQQTATAQREVFKKQKVTLGKKKCMCDFDLKMNTKCSGKATCDKKCSGQGTVEIKGCSFTLKMKKGKGSISNCACAASPTEAPAPTGTGSGSGNGGEGSEASRCACVSKGMGGTGPSPPTGSGSGPAPTGSGSGSGPAPTGSGSGSEPAPPTGSGSGSVLFVDTDNILDLPGFTHRECSVPPYPRSDIDNTGSGVIDGYLMTCGGRNRKETFASCYSLEKG